MIFASFTLTSLTALLSPTNVAIAAIFWVFKAWVGVFLWRRRKKLLRVGSRKERIPSAAPPTPAGSPSAQAE